MAIPTIRSVAIAAFARTVSANLNELLASGARGLDHCDIHSWVFGANQTMSVVISISISTSLFPKVASGRN